MTDEHETECPEFGCPLAFNSQDEVLSHLQWDHNRSEFRAMRMIEEVDNGGDTAGDSE